MSKSSLKLVPRLSPAPLVRAVNVRGATREVSAPSDANFQLLFSRNPYPMYVFDRETLCFLEVNAAATKQYGYSRKEFLAMRLTDIRPTEDVPRLRKALAKTDGSLTFQGYWRHIGKNGRSFEVEVTTQGISFAGRDAMLTVSHDISARRATEEKAAEHATYLQALMENTPLAIVVLDLERHVRMCNPAFAHLFGYHAEDIAGTKIESVLAHAGGSSELSQLIKHATAGETKRAETKQRRSDGALLDVQIIGVPLIRDGKSIGAVGIFEDVTERRRAEAAQRQAEEKFHNLFENAVEGMFQATPQGTYLSVNPALARMYAYSSPAEMIEDVHDIARQLYVNPKRREAFKQLIAEHGMAKAFEFQAVRKDGVKIWVSVTARAVRDAGGNLVSYEGMVEDISGRKRSEIERQVTTEIAHAISGTDNMEDLLHLTHTELKRVFCADNFLVALRDPATGTFEFPFFAGRTGIPPSPENFAQSCAAYVFRTGQAKLIPPAVFRQLVAEGELEQFAAPPKSWLGVPLRAHAATIGVLMVQDYDHENAYTERDLEFLCGVGDRIASAIERRRAEDQLRASEARLRVLVEQLPAALWTVNKDLRFTSALGRGLARLGLRPDQIAGMSLQEYFETSDPAFMPIAAHRRAIKGEPVTFQVEWKGGSYACHVEPLRAAGGEVQGAICTALDVTDRKQLEEQFRQAQKMEAVGRLAGGIAHDFNNLLMVIQGYGDLLAERLQSGDPLRRNAEQIQVAAQRATSLTQQLLAFSRKQMLAPKILNIQTVVADMEKILRRLIGEDIALSTSSARDLWLVKADRSQIEQVVMNLAVNARDAMPGGGRLTIETANVDVNASFSSLPAVIIPGKYVMLAVTDNGSGMDSETQAHIFEPFYTTKEKGKGTGLGLATVYGIVKQSGGNIWVYSEPGRGTTFKVYLPRIAEEVSADRLDDRIHANALPRGSEVILLVEDERGVRELSREYLEMAGYTVLEAEDGHTALELAAMHVGPIHLLMTDVVMPGINGHELAERVTRLRPDTRVLYMSGYTDQAIVHQGILDSGAVLLQKPFTLATLAMKLREILTTEAVV
jgi:two-component system, cell cycle sensor histidine kinase and response regulator CckA